MDEETARQIERFRGVERRPRPAPVLQRLVEGALDAGGEVGAQRERGVEVTITEAPRT